MRHTRQNRNTGSTGPGHHSRKHRVDPTEADLKVLDEPKFCWCGEQHDKKRGKAGKHPWPRAQRTRKTPTKEQENTVEPIPYKRKVHVVMTEEVALPLPADMVELFKIQNYILQQLDESKTTLKPEAVHVAYNDGELLFTFTTNKTEADRPAISQKDVDLAASGKMPSTRNSGVNNAPFPTSPDQLVLPLLQSYGANWAGRVLGKAGTFYFRCPENVNPQMIGALRRTLNRKMTTLQSRGVMVEYELKILTEPKHVIEVTVVR